MKSNCSDVNSIKQNSSVCWVIKSHYKVDEGALSTTWFSYQSAWFGWVNFQVEASKNKIFLSGWVSKPHINKFDFTFDLGKVVKCYLFNVIVVGNSIDWGFMIKDVINFINWGISSSNIRSRTSGLSCVNGGEDKQKDGSHNILNVKVWTIPHKKFCSNPEESSHNRELYCFLQP